MALCSAENSAQVVPLKQLSFLGGTVDKTSERLVLLFHSISNKWNKLERPVVYWCKGT